MRISLVPSQTDAAVRRGPSVANRHHAAICRQRAQLPCHLFVAFGRVVWAAKVGYTLTDEALGMGPAMHVNLAGQQLVIMPCGYRVQLSGLQRQLLRRVGRFAMRRVVGGQHRFLVSVACCMLSSGRLIRTQR